jgi:hypothetical protein
VETHPNKCRKPRWPNQVSSNKKPPHNLECDGL